MNLKNRIRKLEKSLCLNNEMRFKDLLEPNFKYKGMPFHSVEQIFKHFNLSEQVPAYDDEVTIKLILNDLLSDKSAEMRRLKENTSKEMLKNM